MTKHSESTGQRGSEGDSEQKKWGQKRQQFDAVVSSARFNGAVDNLISGTVDVPTLIALLDELNSVQAQRGRYMAEILALKVESRRLATVPYHDGVAEFLIEGSRRIPWLSDGLASQLAVALASASDNPAYLDTVNTAVSNLLLDVTRPLKPDTRNYLRALTDKILASRRLQEARGHLAIVPSVYPSGIPQQLEQGRPFEASQASTAQAAEVSQASTLLATPGAAPAGSFEEYERTTLPSGAVPQSGLGLLGANQVREREPVAGDAQVDARQNVAGAVSANPARASNAIENQLAASTAATVEIREQRESSSALQVTTPSAGQYARAVSPEQAALAGAVAARPSDSGQQAASDRTSSSGSVIAAGKTAPGIGTAGSIDHPVISSASTTPGVGFAPAVRSVTPGVTESGGEHWDDLDDEDLKSEQRPASRRGALGIPVWIIVVTAGAIVACAMGVWALTRESGENASDATAGTSSARPVSSANNNTQLTKKLSGAPSARAVAPSVAAVPNAPPAVPPPPATPPPATPPPAVPPTPAAVPPTPPPVATPTAPPAPKPAAAIPAAPPALAPGRRGKPATNPAPGGVPGAAHSKPSAGTQTSASTPPATKPAAGQSQPSTKPATPAPSPKVTAEEPATDVPGTPRTPTPSRTVDDIIAELRQIPNDGAAIEAKAHEVARIVARSVRKEAEIILQRLIPEEVLVGTETADTRVLEPVRRVVALLLKKVAVDKDDNRAALAIDTLGEWAKLRKHGAAAKLTLDELAEDRVVLSRPVRLRALERVQSRLGMSENDG
ncbi:MAG: hypothetical protein ACM3ZE_22215 [Myxococcales bacterium]